MAPAQQKSVLDALGLQQQDLEESGGEGWIDRYMFVRMVRERIGGRVEAISERLLADAYETLRIEEGEHFTAEEDGTTRASSESIRPASAKTIGSKTDLNRASRRPGSARERISGPPQGSHGSAGRRPGSATSRSLGLPQEAASRRPTSAMARSSGPPQGAQRRPASASARTSESAAANTPGSATGSVFTSQKWRGNQGENKEEKTYSQGGRYLKESASLDNQEVDGDLSNFDCETSGSLAVDVKGMRQQSGGGWGHDLAGKTLIYRIPFTTSRCLLILMQCGFFLRQLVHVRDAVRTFARLVRVHLCACAPVCVRACAHVGVRTHGGACLCVRLCADCLCARTHEFSTDATPPPRRHPPRRHPALIISSA